MQRGFVHKDVASMIVSDASAYLTNLRLGTDTGMTYPFLRSPRLFDIGTEQTRALRSRILMDAAIHHDLACSIVRRSIGYIDRQAGHDRSHLNANLYLSEEDVRNNFQISDRCIKDAT